jgi:hypothetical protein
MHKPLKGDFNNILAAVAAGTGKGKRAAKKAGNGNGKPAGKRQEGKDPRSDWFISRPK